MGCSVCNDTFFVAGRVCPDINKKSHGVMATVGVGDSHYSTVVSAGLAEEVKKLPVQRAKPLFDPEAVYVARSPDNDPVFAAFKAIEEEAKRVFGDGSQPMYYRGAHHVAKLEKRGAATVLTIQSEGSKLIPHPANADPRFSRITRLVWEAYTAARAENKEHLSPWRDISTMSQNQLIENITAYCAAACDPGAWRPFPHTGWAFDEDLQEFLRGIVDSLYLLLRKS